MFTSHLYILFCKALVLSNHFAMGPSIFLVLIYRSYFYIQERALYWLNVLHLFFHSMTFLLSLIESLNKQTFLFLMHSNLSILLFIINIFEVLFKKYFSTPSSWNYSPMLLFFFFFLLCNIVLVLPYINMNPPRVYTCFPSWTPLPPPSPYHPSGSSQCTSPKLPVSCIEPGLAIHFLYDIIHVLMPFSQIILPSLSHRVQRLLYTSVSLLLSCIQGCRYHLSKFHIYELVYCIGVFLSGLLHSV